MSNLAGVIFCDERSKCPSEAIGAKVVVIRVFNEHPKKLILYCSTSHGDQPGYSRTSNDASKAYQSSKLRFMSVCQWQIKRYRKLYFVIKAI